MMPSVQKELSFAPSGLCFIRRFSSQGVALGYQVWPFQGRGNGAIARLLRLAWLMIEADQREAGKPAISA